MLIKFDSTKVKQIQHAIRKVEGLLVEKRYNEIVVFNNEGLTEEIIKKAISDFGKKVTFAPDYVFDNLQIIEINNSDSKTVHVDYDLWIDGKESSLTLMMNVLLKDQEVTIEVEDLHVM